MPEVRALVVGCGNIGAGYDFADHKVLTFAKALSRRPEVAMTVADINQERARRVAERYGVPRLGDPNEEALASFDLVCICVPTPAHLDLLSRCVSAKVPLVVCEKPLVATLTDVAELESLDIGQTRVMVNYIRRFQPAFATLRDRLAAAPASLLGVSVRYVRGLLNNGSHAFDLLEYLTGRRFEYRRPSLAALAHDAFAADPTVTGSLSWGDVPVTLAGVAGADYPLFELDMFYAGRRIAIADGGNSIRWLDTRKGGFAERSEFGRSDALKDYMAAVIDHALSVLRGGEPDNFGEALRLNKCVLTLLNDMETQAR